MKRLVLFCLVIGLMTGCALHSVTYIKEKETFILGKGTHGSYSAQLKNIGNGNVEIILTDETGKDKVLKTLKPNESESLKVPANTKASFKNLGNSAAQLKIKLTGDTGLSMGYN